MGFATLAGQSFRTHKEFVSTWKTDNTVGSVTNNLQVKLPFNSSSMDCIVDWGDNTGSRITSYLNSAVTHTYGATGSYVIRVIGTIPGISFYGSHDKNKFLSVKTWGNARLSIDANASHFRSCAKFDSPNTEDVLNLTGITTLQHTFSDCILMTSIGRMNEWNMSSIQSIFSMFHNINAVSTTGIGVFNQNIGGWDLASCTNFQDVFRGNGAFNNGGSPDIQNWKLGNATTILGMFEIANSFNQPIANWERTVPNFSTLANVTTMDGTFAQGCGFNQPIGNWNVSGVTNMFDMFSRNSGNFNQDIGGWNVSNVTNMANMFNACQFNNGGSASLNNWNVSNVTTMANMFNQNDAINQSLNSWDVSKVTTMNNMFYHANAWNGNVTSWNTVSVVDMTAIFRKCISFNQNVGGWNMTNVTNISQMFDSTYFNYDISGWTVSNVTNATSFYPANGAGGAPAISSANLDLLYNGWSSRLIKPNVSISFGTRKYTAASSAGRAILAGTPSNWIITDGGI